MKVSIITICYNNLKGLQKTYKSIASQTMREFEWIVIDGGSDDGSKDFLQNHDDEIDYWCSEPDKGIYNAQNKGIAKATGEYMIFMNSGDSFYDKEVLRHVFSTPQSATVLYGDWVQLFEDGRTANIDAPRTFSLHFICNDNICHQAMFIKSEVLRKFPYNESYHIYADWAKWIELTLKKHTFQYVPYKICYFLMGGLCCVSDKQEEEKRMLRKLELSPAILETVSLIDYNKPFTAMDERLHKENEVLHQEINSLRKGNADLQKSSLKLQEEYNTLKESYRIRELKESIYYSYPVMKLLYKLIRGYRKHIKNEAIY